MRYKSLSVSLLTLVLSAYPTQAFPCDTCALSQVESAQQLAPGEFNLSLAQQVSHMDKLRLDGRFTPSTMKEQVLSSMSTLTLGAGITSQLRFEIKAPLIYRHYRQIEHEELKARSETGLGDLSFVLRSRFSLYSASDSNLSAGFFAAIKLPTGSSSKLREEASDEHFAADEHDEHMDEMRHGGDHHDDEQADPSAVHSHDIALGSGSVDFPVGAILRGEYGRIGAALEAQYIFRNRGDYGYRFGDDLQLSGWLGGTLNTESSTISRLGARISYDVKNSDRRYGAEEEATASRIVYLGPELEITHKGRLDFRAGFDLPISEDAQGLQLIPSTRLRLSLAYRFG